MKQHTITSKLTRMTNMRLDLTLIQQLNVMCDQLAKQAVQASFDQVLPLLNFNYFLGNKRLLLLVDKNKPLTQLVTYGSTWENAKARRLFTRRLL
jgi:hypothetical protein